ncbi:MAG TPA: NADH-quinone oxidoreductase subunit NuoH [Verrucomicrobiae bacterium]|nr:NADH-quinone oxidoreductase subunit NuoH [Verrucomicrobiae bacterium]
MIPLLLIHLLKIICVIGVMLGIVAYTVLAERKICAWMQDRIGPNRVGPFGLLQPMADGLKFVFKEDVLPHHVNKVYYTLAPMIAMIPALITIAVVPWSSQLVIPSISHDPIPGVIADLNVGILFVFAIASLGVYGIVLAGWASNSKYPFLGGIRSSAQMISYEVCLGLSVVPVFMQTGSLNLMRVVEYQAQNRWLCLTQPLSFFIFLVSAFAETNRLPFDLPEAEQELVGGYNTEYSSMKFAMFFLGEYAAMFVASALMATLFFGGWSLPFAPYNAPALTLRVGLIHVVIFLTKVCAFLFLFIWVRWTIPRFRYDQLMGLGWKIFIPLTLLNILISGVVLAAITK